MDPREISRTLSGLIRGEVTSEQAQRMAQRAGFDSFSELCGSRLPGRRSRHRITSRHVLERLERVRRGETPLDELWRWADELYHIALARRVQYAPREERLLSTALAVLSIICNRALFPLQHKTERHLELLRRALMRGGGLGLDRIFGRAFEDLPVAHLVDRYAEELVEPEETADDDEEPEGIRRWERLSERGRSEGEPPLERRWTDVVMIDRPFRFDQDVLAEANWVIAFSVYTAELWQEDEAEAAAAGAPRARRRDRVPALQRLVPNFDFARYRPRYCYDVDGIAEIVLETPQIGRAEVVYATKLFALANRVREVWLDGEPVKTLLVRPGAGERRRRRSR